MSRATRGAVSSSELTSALIPAPAASVVIRPLKTMEDCHACVELQREVWGFNQADVVPATLLHVVEYVGGLAAGAFDPDGQLVGFVFGVNGVRDGELAHWSHMLAVREPARDHGLGRMLKEHQRRVLGELGIRRIFWSFDPLQAKNAYLNLNKLGAVVVDYVPDMYGTTSSPLHLGMATDRLVVSLETAARGHSVDTVVPQGTPVLTAFPRLTDITMSLAADRTPPMALVEMPGDVMRLMAESRSTVNVWRLSLRDSFQWAMTRGYSVAGVHRTPDGRSFYVMRR